MDPVWDGHHGAVSNEQRPIRRSGGRKRKSGRQARNAQYWMLVSSPDNYRKTLEHGFTVQGIKSRHRKRAETMRSGDRLVFYVTGRMGLTR